MLKKLLPLCLILAAGTASALSVRDDFYLEKIRFIQYHVPDHNSPQYKDAMRQLIGLVRPSDGYGLGDLGRAFMRMGEMGYAKNVLTSAVSQAPDNATAFGDLAHVSAMNNPRDCETARWAYGRAVALQPTQADERHVQQAQQVCDIRR